MGKNILILKWSLFAGSTYFLGVAIAHMLGLKVPVLFIYFNVPSYSYQDHIISFLAFGWSAYMFTAFIDPVKNIGLLKSILISGAAAIIGLSAINLTANFESLTQTAGSRIFWIETSGLFIYWLWLVFFYFRSQKKTAG